METLYEEWRAVKRELERMVCRMENRAAESAEDMRQQAYARGLRDGQAEARHDYCNGCGKQEFYDACNGHYRLIWMFLSLDNPDREIVRTVVERLAAAREEENA